MILIVVVNKVWSLQYWQNSEREKNQETGCC